MMAQATLLAADRKAPVAQVPQKGELLFLLVAVVVVHRDVLLEGWRLRSRWDVGNGARHEVYHFRTMPYHKIENSLALRLPVDRGGHQDDS